MKTGNMRHLLILATKLIVVSYLPHQLLEQVLVRFRGQNYLCYRHLLLTELKENCKHGRMTAYIRKGTCNCYFQVDTLEATRKILQIIDHAGHSKCSRVIYILSCVIHRLNLTETVI